MPAKKKHTALYYDNHNTASLPGEKWAGIPYYEGYYEASNLGRIRSLDRYVPHPRHGTQFVEGRILRQKVHINPFKLDKKGKHMVDLSVCLHKDGKSSYVNVRRLVFSAFKKRALDFAKDRTVVVNLNTDGYNCRLSNLGLWTESQKVTRMVERGRISDYLSRADRSKWPKREGIRVAQYSLDGKRKIKEYDSIRAASDFTGYDQKGISMAAHGKAKHWRKFKWMLLPDKPRGGKKNKA